MAASDLSSPHVRWTLQVTDSSHDEPGHVPEVARLSNPTPIRKRAPSPCPPSYRSSQSSSSPSDSSESGAQSPPRGRALHILGPNHGLIPSSTARRQARSSLTDLNTGTTQYRSPYHFNQGPLNEIELLTQNETYIAPVSRGSPSADIPEVLAYASAFDSDATTVTAASTFGVSLSRASTFASAVDLSRFTGHRDTFALLDLRGLSLPAPWLPSQVFTHLACYLDFDTYSSLRLTCRSWSAGITAACSPPISSAQLLPPELLQEIFAKLPPSDFNAARRTCRAWMMAGLEKRLLGEMCRRGGWWRSVLIDKEWEGQRISEEWAMSKRLATECSLSWGWTGNGLDIQREDQSARSGMPQNWADEDTGNITGKESSSMVLTAQTDFLELGRGIGSCASGEVALHFTVSVCGRFVLVIEAYIIYVYRLGGPGSSATMHGRFVGPVTSIICPKRVLAVSMDTSSRRYAVAALLEDRTGMVCDINVSRLSTCFKDPLMPRTWKMEEHTVRSISAQGLGGRNLTLSADLIEDYKTEDAQSHRSQRARMRMSSSDSPPLPAATMVDSPIQFSGEVAGIPIETGPRSIYRGLCSREDPPISVAICPQRRCVAFGCCSGIELHWVDALTGQDLNRWFPLTAPSDFLYFLPPRRDRDSAKKLRLVSSAGCEGQKGGWRSQFQTTTGLRSLAMSSRDELQDQRESSEHFKAIPSSDGNLMLYTDPESKLLCLGSDTLTSGPTKLERRIMFEGPPGAVPEVYAAGGDLRWGMRIAVGYGEHLWLFCVPPDILAGGKSGEWESIYGGSRETWEAQARRIRGVQIGLVEGMAELAVDSCGGSLTIWAFSIDGKAYTWQICGEVTKRVKKRAVQQDGTVLDLEDSDGDVIMRDAPSLLSADLDGTSSLSHNHLMGCTSPSCWLSKTGAVERYVGGAHKVGTRDEDEGYWSDDEGRPGRGSYAIHVPPLDGRWSLEEADWDWDVDCMGIGTGDGTARATDPLDILEMSRMDCEVL
ncbi:hypothetical protein MMC13_003325 [Lambiella insularis]|nr:hypothetical protein [Lambiella insularis]